jgi:hypothetical protein
MRARMSVYGGVVEAGRRGVARGRSNPEIAQILMKLGVRDRVRR